MKSPLHINPYSALSEQIVMLVILINSLIIFLDASNVHSKWLIHADTLCSLFFIGEMVLKMRHDGVVDYWKSGWNKLDGTLVILSLPSIMASFLPLTDLSFLMVFRMLRAFRFFRLIHFFPGVEQIGRNFRKALQESFSLFVGYFLIILIFALFSTSIFGHAAPQYFGTPIESIYSIFRLFTIEGWYDIPDAVAEVYGTWGVVFSRLYFVFLLIIGGVIGLSLINSVFVDAMVSDNNDELINKIDELEKKIDELIQNGNKQQSES